MRSSIKLFKAFRNKGMTQSLHVYVGTGAEDSGAFWCYAELFGAAYCWKLGLV